MKETVYGVFAVRSDGGVPLICKLMCREVFDYREEASLKAGELKLVYNSNFEVRAIECEVR